MAWRPERRDWTVLRPLATSTTTSGPSAGICIRRLALNFQILIDVLNEVRASACPGSDANLLRTYEVWLKTGSRRAENLLRQQGVVPFVNARINRH